jgi:hypothetical protein
VQAVAESHERAVRAHCDGLIGRWMTVEASRLYARLVHPAGKGRTL